MKSNNPIHSSTSEIRSDVAHPTNLNSRLSPQELAAHWGISEKTLERWRHQGIGPIYIRLPGKIVYRVEDVEAYERGAARQGTDQSAMLGGVA